MWSLLSWACLHRLKARMQRYSLKASAVATRPRSTTSGSAGRPAQSASLQPASPLFVVLLNGSALAVNWAQQHANAVLEAWYPGEEGGTAIAETLAGDNNPGGRLPLTFYASLDQVPAFEVHSGPRTDIVTSSGGRISTALASASVTRPSSTRTSKCRRRSRPVNPVVHREAGR